MVEEPSSLLNSAEEEMLTVGDMLDESAEGILYVEGVVIAGARG